MHPAVYEILAQYGHEEAVLGAGCYIMQVSFGQRSGQDQHEFVFQDVEDQPRSVVLECRTTLRCVIDRGDQVQTYLQQLARRLTGVGVDLIMCPPLGLGFRVSMDDRTALYHGSNMQEALQYFMRELPLVLYASAAMLRRSRRIDMIQQEKDRKGVHKKLNPERLVELTLLACFDEYVPTQ